VGQQFHHRTPADTRGGHGFDTGVHPGKPGQVALDELSQLLVTADLSGAGVIDPHLTRPHGFQSVGITSVQCGEVLSNRVSPTCSASLPARQLDGIVEIRKPRHPGPLAPVPTRSAPSRLPRLPAAFSRKLHAWWRVLQMVIMSPDPADRRVAIVTGASQGIGASLTAALRAEGYAVVATSRSIHASEENGFLTVPGDITQVETARRVVDQAVARFGRIDTLINNAGLFIAKPFMDYTLDDFGAITALNLAGFFHMTQRAIRQMVVQGSGHIVNTTASLVDHPLSHSPAALTSLTKGGLAAVTRSLAIEYASHGIRVNAVSPGVIRNPTFDPASYEGSAELHPLGRIGEVGDIVDGILYLERAPFVTGEILHIDGGQAAGH
jgi:NAD(P)-dependent dehydrogenase (short-subunit alcohol dehydrogenase family)